MSYQDFMSSVHKSTKRDYLARVNDKDYPKPYAASLAKKWAFDYWDGSRKINYGGYKYDGRWANVAAQMVQHYGIKAGDKILDIGCGKGFLLYDFTQVCPGVEVIGLDISEYAIQNSLPEIKDSLKLGNANNLPFNNDEFDLVVSLTTLHNLHAPDLYRALREMERVGKQHKYLCVESYRNEQEKANLLYWQVTCEAFNTPDEWDWWFELTGYNGDHSFIFFE
ncbi:methylase involved in ubiquinone/menaquinone biosynthesis [SAR116 cluster alpha proteobacterium HIMB100]|nr:methylase involved in ubiquinone/menaquinone biosynthesis [SAR116 cluster alpha proteobacterium HIMB100]